MPATTNTQTSRAKRNQGRKPLSDAEKTVRITITLTETDLALLEKISPNGNLSEGVRWALRAQQREAKVLLAEALRVSAEADPVGWVSDEELTRDIEAKRKELGLHVAH
ncbi:MAG: hypothetical protein U0350_40035 [Caldilineaceae bacterium]